MRILLHLLLLTYFISSCQSDFQQNDSSQNDSSPLDSVITSQSNGSTQKVFDPPFAHLNIPFSTMTYNTKKGLNFDTPTGSHVEIPSHAFCDSEGNSIDEDIEINYREFHSITDVMLSGINMKYSEGDTVGADFETAGMFEIRAYHKGQELKLKHNKTIRVDLASFKAGSFNHYHMNDSSGNWEFLETKSANENTRKLDRISALDNKLKNEVTLCNFEPQKYESGMQLFDLDYDISRFQELSFVNDAMWICVGDENEKKLLEKTLSGFNDMSLEPADSCGVFKLKVWRKNGSESITNEKTFHVSPVWSGKALDRAKLRVQESIANLKRLRDARQIAEREADLVRSFELRGMGVFNCDRILEMIKFITVPLVLKFKEKIQSFFYITNNKTVAIRYWDPQYPEFKVNPNSTNSIIAILPDNKIGTVSEEAFEKALKKFKANPDKGSTFELELIESPLPVTDKKNFEQHVARF